MASEAASSDRRYMAAAIRLSASHLGLTGTNPSVATLIVKDGKIIGRGVTALGGRPHAETEALAEAGEGARGATAYVTLEPCAHHGRTPPCAMALVNSGVARVVGAAADPDPRVSGKGYAMLREAGIEVTEGVLAAEAAAMMSGYLTRTFCKRPEVILKLAVSADGFIGLEGQGRVAITGPVANAQVHLMRAQADAILIGIGTALADDPELTVRLPGLEARSPIRIVLDPMARLPLTSKLAQTARDVPVWLAAAADAPAENLAGLTAMGVRLLATETLAGRIALPELMDDLAAQGISSVLVEGGAETARRFAAESLIDRFVLFEGERTIGQGGLIAPFNADHLPVPMVLTGQWQFGNDRCRQWERTEPCSPAS